MKALFHLSTDSNSVSTNSLSADMQTTPASANDMLKRLHQKGLISHVKYKGATITEKGKKYALRIIRKHRLWEVFLVNKLNFQWDQVHEIAEQLEHIKSPLLTERLDAFLDHPKFDPHGDPIPDADGNFNVGPQVSIQEIEPSQTGILVAVTDDNSALLRHLDNLGIRIGIKITVNEKSEFDQSIQATIEGRHVFLSREVANHLMMTLS